MGAGAKRALVRQKKSRERSMANSAAPVDLEAPRTFKPGSVFRRYLASKPKLKTFMEHRVVFTLNEILSLLKGIILEEGMLDPNNTFIVLCNKPLEDALDVKALHLAEIRDRVLVHMEPFHGSIYSPTAMRRHGLSSAFYPSVKSVRFDVTHLNSHSGPSESFQMEVDMQAYYYVKPDFLKVLRQVPTVPKTRIAFTYEEVARYLANYILSRKEKFFDNRNIKVALVAGDDLGKAFNVSAFHRTQVTTLMKQQLIVPDGDVKLEVKAEEKPRISELPHPPAGTSASIPNETVIKTEEEVKTEPSFIQQQPTVTSNVAHPEPEEGIENIKIEPDLPKWTTTEDNNEENIMETSGENGSEINLQQSTSTSGVRIATNLFATSSESNNVLSQVKCEQHHANETVTVPGSSAKASETISNGIPDQRKPKRAQNGSVSNGDDSSSSPGQATSPRRKRRRQSSFSYAVLGYSSDDKETVYSAQGYETVAVNSDYEYDEDEEEEQQNETLTEYEVDSEADREQEEALGSVHSTSCEDSDIQDVVVRNGRPQNLDTSRDSENWADSESDWELSNFDPELGPRSSEVWKCVTCGQPNTPFIRYCNRCWNERRGWLPDPPRRRRRRNKQTKGQNMKGGSTATATATSSEAAISSQELTNSVAEEDGNSSGDAKDDLNFAKMKLETEMPTASTSSSAGSSSGSRSRDMCDFCLSRPKNAGLIHGRIVHQVCCYPCAKKLFKKKATCPMCRRKIEKIAEIITS